MSEEKNEFDLGFVLLQGAFYQVRKDLERFDFKHPHTHGAWVMFTSSLDATINYLDIAIEEARKNKI